MGTAEGVEPRVAKHRSLQAVNDDGRRLCMETLQVSGYPHVQQPPFIFLFVLHSRNWRTFCGRDELFLIRNSETPVATSWPINISYEYDRNHWTALVP